MASSAAKATGWAAGAATLVTALALGAERIEATYAHWKLSDRDRVEFSERRRHALDRDIRHFILLQTDDGLVEVKVYGSGCITNDGIERGTVLPSRSHRSLALAEMAPREPALRMAGWGAAQTCRPAENGQCNIPADHPAWDREEHVGTGPDGAPLYDLIWDHGDRLRARWVGRWDFLGWVCCAH